MFYSIWLVAAALAGWVSGKIAGDNGFGTGAIAITATISRARPIPVAVRRASVIRLDANTGFSFLNLDDNTVQIQLTSGAINLRVRRLDQNDVG